ncbi:unnamed protein product, partial [Prorocentrum cordatum]
MPLPGPRRALPAAPGGEGGQVARVGVPPSGRGRRADRKRERPHLEEPHHDRHPRGERRRRRAEVRDAGRGEERADVRGVLGGRSAGDRAPEPHGPRARGAADQREVGGHQSYPPLPPFVFVFCVGQTLACV